MDSIYPNLKFNEFIVSMVQNIVYTGLMISIFLINCSKGNCYEDLIKNLYDGLYFML